MLYNRSMCKIEGCEGKVYGRGWCSKHWQRWYTKGSPHALKREQHRLRHSPEYNSWYNMKIRCYWRKSKSYPDYGGRGIKVCERWRNSFTNFYEDMGPKPSAEYSIDRTDNDGNYEPSNCKWELRLHQANNNRHNRFITIDGETHTVTQWSRKLGLNHKTVSTRLNQLGWPIDKALGL